MTDEKTTIVWREWYPADVVKTLTEFGTLPRYESDVVIKPWDGGEDIVTKIAYADSENGDGETFREGADIVIIEPKEFAGRYVIVIEYEPVFYAYKEEDDE